MGSDGEDAAGWALPKGSRKHHYFPDGDSTSLCLGYGFYFGPRFDEHDAHSENCSQCKKRLLKLREPKP